MKSISKIAGVVRHYEWGGSSFIPALLNVPNDEDKSFAEYWLGAHASAPSKVLEDGSSLADFKPDEQLELLGEGVMKRFGALPYLFKVLDVRDMLSIQVHPTKAAAEEGFSEENRKGIPASASYRNYKDDNHKPELMFALSDFWLLHGFKSKEAIVTLLRSRACYAPMLEVLEKAGVEGAFEWAIAAADPAPLAVSKALLQELDADAPVDKRHPEYWIYKWTRQEGATHIGLLVVLLMNVVNAKPGDVVFQGAGVIHAYLEGQNIELMANSDNVLRGGLTVKHMDADELMRHTLFGAIDPQGSFLEAKQVSEYERLYVPPVEDFALSEIVIPEGKSVSVESSSLEIFLCVDGCAAVSSKTEGEGFDLAKGEAFMAKAGRSLTLSGAAQGVRIFRAQVNQQS